MNGVITKEKSDIAEDKSPSCFVISSSTTGLYLEDRKNSTAIEPYSGDKINPSFDDKTITTVL